MISQFPENRFESEIVGGQTGNIITVEQITPIRHPTSPKATGEGSLYRILAGGGLMLFQKDFHLQSDSGRSEVQVSVATALLGEQLSCRTVMGRGIA
jgi:hypothetical protein